AKKNTPILELAQQEFDAGRKKNCWEMVKCGRESFCEAGVAEHLDGIFGGKNGGRFCAFIAGTSCKDGLPRPDEEKIKLCASCQFYAELIRDEFNIQINVSKNKKMDTKQS
ncbi:MAG: hypothetical protein HQL86_09060, partial [Magnetococcales bacterium]|nr:hypothetical protein [Magnetococcales bacterium]